MLFNSYAFILKFLPIALIGYLFLSRFKDQAFARGWLVLASLAFYASAKTGFLGLLLGSIFFNFFVISWLQNTPQLKARYWITFLGVVLNLGVLCYFKYANLIILEFSGDNSAWAKVVFPLGLSFFTFQQIALLMDVKNGRNEKVTFPNYFQFIAFFPYLIAGPISRYRDMAPQFEEKKKGNLEARILVGLTIFAIGLFKKTNIAEYMSGIADPVFKAATDGFLPGLFQSWLGALSYSLQIYFDFSGYSDMAIGVAWLFGIRLPINFNSPFKAGNFLEFWRGWHLTLSSLIMAFVYTPLATMFTRVSIKNKIKGLREFILVLAIPALVTFVLMGAWHGEGWPFIAFGVVHGILFSISYRWKKFKSRSLTFIAAVVAFAIFRSTDLTAAWILMKGLFGWNGLGLDHLTGMTALQHFGCIALLILVVWFTPNTRQILAENYPALPHEQLSNKQWASSSLRWRPNLAGIAFSVVVTILAILGLGAGTSFVYFQF